MRKIILYVSLLVSACLVSCKGEEWDTEEEMRELTLSWCYFIDDIMYYSIQLNDTLEHKDDKIKIIAKSSLKDSLFVEFKYDVHQPGSDSLYVTSTLTQIGDSTIVKTDGFRYSDKFWVHLFTTDPGIINYDGIFHIDFYEIGKDTPWAWSEVKYRKSNRNHSATKEGPIIEWY
ncbi:MAG: hypothetical protein J6U22_05745 [Bacteroidaceae bacterium]|nr:hypothetical protein [Bacteroidaceae bacterium]